jgi:hypothetical protein
LRRRAAPDLDAAKQRVQPERDLDGADFGRAGRDDVVAGERQFEPSAEADAVHTGNDRDRQQFEQFQEIDAADCRLAAATLLDARGELRDLRPGREMAQPTAQNDRSAPGIAGCGDLVGDRAEQGRAEQIVRPVLPC